MIAHLRRSATTLTCLGLSALLLTACGTSAAPKTANVAGGAVVQRLQGGWETLDPMAQGSTDSYQIVGSFYDYLLAMKGSKVVPYLATAWTTTPTSVKFTLRRDATCSDGTPVTATVVANSLKRLLNVVAETSFQSIKSAFGPSPYTIVGDDGASTVTVRIAKPFSGLLNGFTNQNPNSAIVCPKGLADPASLRTTPAGSGPFTLTSALPGDSITLTARPDWHWGPDGLSTKSSGFPQTITYRVITNDTTAANLLTTGGLDVALILGPDNQRLVSDKALNRATAHPFMATDVIFNQASGRPTTDRTVRQALSAAIDPKAFGQAAYNGYATVATSVLSNDAQCFDPNAKKLVPTGGASKAKQIMSAAGFQMGGSGWLDKSTKQPMQIVVAGGTSQNNGPDYLAEAIMSAGFSVKLLKTDRATFAMNYLSGNFDVALSIPSAPTPDPNGGGSLGLIVGPARPNGSNATRLDHPEIDAEVAAANASTGAQSCKHWANVQELLLKSNIVMPLVTPQYQWYGRGIDLVPGPTIVPAVNLKRVKQG